MKLTSSEYAAFVIAFVACLPLILMVVVVAAFFGIIQIIVEAVLTIIKRWL
jgi:hypothetical protein